MIYADILRKNISSRKYMDNVEDNFSPDCTWYTSSKNYFSSTTPMGIPHRSTKGSHDDHDNFDGQLNSPMVPSQHNNHLQAFLQLNATKLGAHCNDNKNFIMSTVLQESLPGILCKPHPMPLLTSLPTTMSITQTRTVCHTQPPWMSVQPSHHLCYTYVSTMDSTFDCSLPKLLQMWMAGTMMANSWTMPIINGTHHAWSIHWPKSSQSHQ